MKEENKNTWYGVVIAVLVIVIVILLLLTQCGKNGNGNLTPTGNVDVFNIDINNCNCDEAGKCENKDNNSNNKNNYPTWKDDASHITNQIYVDDESGNYIYHQDLKIFENPYYEYTNKIAPGVSNSYSFVVHNDSDINVKYYLEMYSECNYDLDLKYRLKKNGKYVIGNDSTWVSANELKTSFAKLNSGKDDTYILDWKWEYESGKDEKDTYIGENMSDTYKLKAKFYFEQV